MSECFGRSGLGLQKDSTKASCFSSQFPECMEPYLAFGRKSARDACSTLREAVWCHSCEAVTISNLCWQVW